MPTPSGLVTKQELIDAQLDTAHLGRVVNSKDASGAPINTSTNRTGGVNKTLDALEADYLEAIQGAGGESIGTWTAGITTFTKYNEYAVYNGIPYKPRTSATLPYVAQGADPTIGPDDANVQPYQEITEAQVVALVKGTLPELTDVIYSSIADVDPSLLKVGDNVRVSDIDYTVSASGVSIGGGLFLRPLTESEVSNSNTLTDLSTGEAFRPALDIRTMPLSDAFRDIMVRSASGFKPRIVCYGDSNTRYYQAESTGNKTGPLCNAYGSQLDILCSKYPFLYGASVQTLGFPGERVQYGIDNFNLINPLTNFVVLGWGTNDIKLNNANMDNYLNSVVELFEKCIDADICPIMLGIPWFSDDYGDQGVLTQDRLKTWNASLYALCLECGVPFIDTYNLTRSNTDFYFNESTTKRHYSVAATKQVAQKIIEVLSSLMSSSGESLSSYRNSFHDASSITISNNTLIEREVISLGATGANQTQSFEVMKIRPFKTTKFNGIGRFCVSLYVSESCEFDLAYNGFTHRITLSPQVDNGCNYPIVRLSDTNGANFSTSDGVTLTSYSGNVFVRSVSFEDGESNVSVFSNSFESVNSGGDLPPAAPQSRSIFVESLLKTVRYSSNQDAWFDESGLIAVGTTTQRDDQSNFGAPNGFKFFSTTDSNRYRWDLNTLSWVVF